MYLVFHEYNSYLECFIRYIQGSLYIFWPRHNYCTSSRGQFYSTYSPTTNTHIDIDNVTGAN